MVSYSPTKKLKELGKFIQVDVDGKCGHLNVSGMMNTGSYHSYIKSLDFTPEKQQAQYLKLLNSNDTLYNEYFWWKDPYRVEVGVDQMARHGFCDFSKKLHQDEGVKKYSYEFISESGVRKRKLNN